MGLSAVNPPRLLAALLLATATAMLALWLRTAPAPLDGLVRSSYDLLHIRGQASLTDSPVVIVYLDLPSYQNLLVDPGHVWPRGLHAKLLRRLTAAGARAVVFDIVFGESGADPDGDNALAEAIRSNGRVVLAAEHNNQASQDTGEQETRGRLSKLEPPVAPFAKEARGWGIAEQTIDDDFIVRRYLAGFPDSQMPSLTWAAANWLKLPVTTRDAAMAEANRMWLRYYGAPLTIPHTSYTAALNPKDLPDEFFRDKIVLIGGRPFVKQAKERSDEFRSPFHSWANKDLFMPGVEVHATEMLNLLRSDLLRRPSTAAESGLLLLGAFLLGGGLIWLRPIPATSLAFGGAIGAYALAQYGFSHGVWFPWMLVSAVQAPIALGGSVLFYSIEWYRARKRFVSKIREQAALIDKAHDAILVEELGGKIAYANPGAEQLYGWSLDEFQRQGITAELFSPNATAVASARAAAIDKGGWDGELRLQTKPGDIVIVNSRWTLIRDEKGTPTACLIISNDVTERKQLEAQFLRTQRMNTIGTLAGGMAHDLNNALSPILMGVQLLRRKTTDEESTRLLGVMETNTHRSADMVRQVLLFARGRGGEFERLELGPLVKELEKIVRETFPKDVVVESFLPADLWPVRGNLTQLHQVLLNLCVNARDAMPQGGRLSFAGDNVELKDSEAAKIRGGRAGEYVSLLVSDTGTGMPSEVQSRIFEPFFTTKADGLGTGIGLSTVLRIVKGHNGFLRVESEPGQGTTFEIFLPRAVEAAAVVAVAAGTDIPAGHGELILLADDEQAIRDLVREGLIAHGYRVVAAANGEEALQLFRQHADQIRLVLTDNAMPVMDGARTITEIRKLKPRLPVILASGEAPAEGLAQQDGVRMVSKPFSLEDILALVHQILSETTPK